MKKIYLSGPIANCTLLESRGWRELAKSVLGEQYQFLDPTDRPPFPEVVGLDKQDICECDLVLVYPWKPGWGTAMEILFANYEDKPVYVVWDMPMPCNIWVAAHTDRVFSSWEECFHVLIQLGK